ncbi:TIGR03084 family metal-binding protein [Amycolatopsis acidiphila]|uniref:TIGR03084 family protein n=1 Tax=Amycolatopsis acidiphila TaxID=715473 RepID=A0A558A1D6_9PSEU|nr:TIGR03084 family metal-binding protein [Amycolatopsis acidiphila]TVT18067.1 TIGR03084 family protein [Amycolatopsis acidiphila]UIJ56638.1 TIGR03084 family metal-binding protein [Amycolatopsis acidiphila]GHG56079.1 TIGR03084 family protein [Amycolatopsis acidiphila]
MVDLGPILGDLAAESQSLDDVVAGPGTDWATPTPAEGWTIGHQIAHLAWTDAKALIAVRTPGDFPEEIKRALAAGPGYVGEGIAEEAKKPREELLARWRAGREALAAALPAAPPGSKFPWYGPPMSAASMTTARLMETWAHAQDVYDALGLRREPGGGLRHIARFGVRTRDFAFAVHSLAPPAAEFRVELRAPDGELWAYGPADATQRVTGSALDFCLVVTQRRHPADTDLQAVGADAVKWLEIAQAFAGPPGRGRKAGQFG